MIGIAGRTLFFAGLVFAVGCTAVRWLGAGDRTRRDPGERLVHATLCRMGAWAAGVGLVGLAVIAFSQFQAFRDPFSPFVDELHLLFLGTRWGHVWFGGVASLGLAGAAMVAAAREAGSRVGVFPWIVATTSLAVAAFYPALNGHASSVEPTWLGVLADGLHVLAAGVWVGSLGAIVALLRVSDRRSALDRDAILQLLPRFSVLALAGAAVLVATGSLAAWLHVPGPGALVTSRYGLLLLLKLCGVIVVITLGARNSRWWRARRRTGEGLSMPPGSAAEWIAGQVVILVTAVLVGAAPP